LVDVVASSNSSGFPDQLQGTIEVDDGSPLPVGTLRLIRVSLGGDGAVTQPFTNTQGIFMLPAVPGEYVVKVALGLRSYYVKSITYGNIDLTKTPLTVRKGADEKIHIVLAKTRPGDTSPGVKVSGRITDWKPGPTLALSWVVAPTDLVQIAD